MHKVVGITVRRMIGRVDCIELDLQKFPFCVYAKDGEIVLKKFEFSSLDEAKKACNEMHAEITKYRLEKKNEQAD